MKRENNPLVLCLFGILPVVWLGLLLAPAAHGGLPEIVARFPAVMNDPFHIELCGDSLKTVLVLLCAYGLAVGVILSPRRNYRRGEEHGSAKWGSARTVNRKYRAAAPETSCQGLFNQIHKKATKKCQKQILAPDTFADGLFAPA